MKNNLNHLTKLVQKLGVSLLVLVMSSSAAYAASTVKNSPSGHKASTVQSVKKKSSDVRQVGKRTPTRKKQVASGTSKKSVPARNNRAVKNRTVAVSKTPIQANDRTEMRMASSKPLQLAPQSTRLDQAGRLIGAPEQQSSRLRSDVALSGVGAYGAAWSASGQGTEPGQGHLNPQDQSAALPTLSASVALVVDQDTNEVLFSKNVSAVLPIASITKLMTGLVIADAGLPMDEIITLTEDDVDTHKGSRSRLAVGTALTRGELMHLALMSSENRAANALGRTFPGGMNRFVSLMNSKARELGMLDTRFVDPTGLFSENRSSARDLATLVSAAYQRPILRDLSTSPGHQLSLGRRTLQYNNSNQLIHNPEWEIGLQKTGYIAEAGRCLVMQVKVAGRKIIMVFLNAAGKINRMQDAESMRRWVEMQTIHSYFARPQG